jgi:hypothetical protein
MFTNMCCEEAVGRYSIGMSAYADPQSHSDVICRTSIINHQTVGGRIVRGNDAPV